LKISTIFVRSGGSEAEAEMDTSGEAAQEEQLCSNSLGANAQGCAPSDSGESRLRANGWKANQFHALASLRFASLRTLISGSESFSSLVTKLLLRM
jgi:hypothetical protein